MDSKENNLIFVGKKPIKNYIHNINLQLRKGENQKIILKARGKFISKAVDIAELSKRNNNLNLETKNIKINTEEYQKENKDKIKVSTIEIQLTRN